MASTKVISTTWAKKDLVKKLQATLKRMDDEIANWDKYQLTFKKRLATWEKKATAYGKANANKALEVSTHERWNEMQINLSFEKEEFFAAVGEQPEQITKPSYKDTSYSKSVSDYDQVLNAIALIEGSTDTEFKINTTSVWASFIR